MSKILVTGGAGFIGSHLVDQLIALGYQVRVLDNLDPQVHGKDQKIPDYLNQEAELVIGDVRDNTIVRKCLEDIEYVVHFAAAVGVGQSAYMIQHYIDVNNNGSAVLLQEIIGLNGQIKKMLVASSMSIYGEGLYECSEHGSVSPKGRTSQELQSKAWELKCPQCDRLLVPQPTPETKRCDSNSVYAISKRVQEELFLSTGFTYNIPTIALRFFNVWGARQALSNPYTGVAAIFCSRFLNNNDPIIYEDGGQIRDFVHVSDIVQACILSLQSKSTNCNVFNVGSGENITINQIADLLKQAINSDNTAQTINEYRIGDIRHCFADITNIQNELGYKPQKSLFSHIDELVSWVMQQKSDDTFHQAKKELEKRGLVL
jgi:dTDP-L-rhamnose 4-epimerase